MHIHVALTEEIIDKSLALHYHLQPAGIKLKRRLLYIPLIMFAISAYIIYTEVQQPQLGQNFYMALLYISFGVVYYYFMRHRLMRSGKKMLAGLGENARFEVQVNGDEVTTTTTTSTFTHKLDAFTGALMNKEIVLLYQANDSFSMFHESFFETGDFPRFKELVKTHVQRTADVSEMNT
jgi:hypothetical protein